MRRLSGTVWRIMEVLSSDVTPDVPVVDVGASSYKGALVRGKASIVDGAIRQLASLRDLLDTIARAIDRGELDEKSENAKRLSVAFGSARRLLDNIDLTREKIQDIVWELGVRQGGATWQVRRGGLSGPVSEARKASRRKRHLAGPERYVQGGRTRKLSFLDRLDDFIDEVEDLAFWLDELRGDIASLWFTEEAADELIGLFDRLSDQLRKLWEQVRRAMVSAGIV